MDALHQVAIALTDIEAAIERDNAESYGRLTLHREGTASVYIRDPWGKAVEIMKRSSRS